MKKIIYSLTICLGLFLANTATAQNWTATDINGVEHTLQDYLDDGKTVLVDLSAHWCGPCWGWHQSGVMEELYEKFGPNGTDDLMIFMIDGSGGSYPLSTLALLQGASGSQGDWTAGTHYPIIGPYMDGTTGGSHGRDVANNYSFGGFPTLFVHCPGSTTGVEISRAGYDAFLEDWLTKCPAGFTDETNDVMLLDHSTDICPGDNAELKLFVKGTQDLTSATFELKNTSDGSLHSTIDWTGNISSPSIQTITLTELPVFSNIDVDIEVTSVNGGMDDDPSGNIEHYIFRAGGTEDFNITLEIDLDGWASEIGWNLKGSDGSVLDSKATGSYGSNNTTVTENITLTNDDCFIFEMLDTYGDGMSGNAFRLKDASGNVFFEAPFSGQSVPANTLISDESRFVASKDDDNDGLNNLSENALGTNPSNADTDSDGTNDGDEVAAGTDPLVADGVNIIDLTKVDNYEVYPNPTSDVVTVEINTNQEGTVNVDLVNILGQTVATNNDVNDKVTFDVSNLNSGIYLVKTTLDGKVVATSQLMVK